MAEPDFGGLYNETMGNLKFNESKQDAPVIQEYGTYNEGTKTWSGGAADTRTNYQEGLLTEQEPGVKTAEANRANKGGILTSGANAQRKATIAQNFATKRTGNQLRLTEGRGKGLTTLKTAKEEKEHGEVNAETKRAREEDEYRKNNPIVAAPAAAAPAAPPQPGAPGNLGKWVNVPGGSVRINNAQGPRVISQKKQPITRG